MTEQTTTETTEPETVEVDGGTPNPPIEHTLSGDATEKSDDEAETFPRAYVEKLREEAAEHRVRAKRADDLAAALWTAQVAATGRLADATDLTMPEGVDPLDTLAVAAAVDELLARKPHLAARRPMGQVGQGVSAPSADVDLAGMLRARA